MAELAEGQGGDSLPRSPPCWTSVVLTGATSAILQRLARQSNCCLQSASRRSSSPQLPRGGGGGCGDTHGSEAAARSQKGKVSKQGEGQRSSSPSRDYEMPPPGPTPGGGAARALQQKTHVVGSGLRGCPPPTNFNNRVRSSGRLVPGLRIASHDTDGITQLSEFWGEGSGANHMHLLQERCCGIASHDTGGIIRATHPTIPCGQGPIRQRQRAAQWHALLRLHGTASTSTLSAPRRRTSLQTQGRGAAGGAQAKQRSSELGLCKQTCGGALRRVPHVHGGTPQEGRQEGSGCDFRAAAGLVALLKAEAGRCRMCTE